MKKAQALAHWRELDENLPILPHFRPIAYKAEGSKYGTCGIRIDGTPEFVDAVLSHMKELIEGECLTTRLVLSRAEVDGSKLGKEFYNKEAGAEVCYIRLQERGDALGINRYIAARSYANGRKIALPDRQTLMECAPSLFENEGAPAVRGADDEYLE